MKVVLINVIAFVVSVALVILINCDVINMSIFIAWLPSLIVNGFFLLLFALIGLIMVLGLSYGGKFLTESDWSKLCLYHNKPFAKNVGDLLITNDKTNNDNININVKFKGF